MSEELQLINRHLASLDPEDQNYQEILNQLTPLVNHLLDNDLQTLMQLLYRIDVSEEKFKQALAFSEPQEMGEKVARLILDRQLKKIETRRRYKKED